MPNRTTIIALSSARENSSDLGSGSAFCRRILRCDRRITGSTPACGTTPLNASHLVNAKKLFLPHEDTSIKLSFLKRIHRNCRHRLNMIRCLGLIGTKRLWLMSRLEECHFNRTILMSVLIVDLS